MGELHGRRHSACAFLPDTDFRTVLQCNNLGAIERDVQPRRKIAWPRVLRSMTTTVIVVLRDPADDDDAVPADGRADQLGRGDGQMRYAAARCTVSRRQTDPVDTNYANAKIIVTRARAPVCGVNVSSSHWPTRARARPCGCFRCLARVWHAEAARQTLTKREMFCSIRDAVPLLLNQVPLLRSKRCVDRLQVEVTSKELSVLFDFSSTIVQIFVNESNVWDARKKKSLIHNVKITIWTYPGFC